MAEVNGTVTGLPVGLPVGGKPIQAVQVDSYRVRIGEQIDLGAVDTRATDGFDGGKPEGKALLRKMAARLHTLQEVLYAQAQHCLLIVIQAMDTGGKDSTIRHVFSGVNPQGVKVVSFKQPTPLERAHDFLWRVHPHTPAKGEIAIFNRSHYEDVLVARVHGLVPEGVWRQRYEHIRAFEQLLIDEGTTVVKFFLHISPEKQKERLQDRLDDPSKHWKFDIGDLDERRRWGEYMTAYSEMMAETSTPESPWYVVPADRKWYRNLVVSQTILNTLERMGLCYPPPPDGLEQVVIE